MLNVRITPLLMRGLPHLFVNCFTTAGIRFKVIKTPENMTTAPTVSETSFADLDLIHRGKVRDVYEISDSELLLVATDRLSAFDCVLPTPIERKGEVLTALSVFWFHRLAHVVDHHLINADFDQMPEI